MKLKASTILWMYAVASCLWFGSVSSSAELPLLIRSVVDAANPTVRIAGLNGLCVTVTDYHNGAPIQLHPCKSNADVNQLFTFHSDDTIRTTNGWCMFPCAEFPGSYVMVFRCPSTLTDKHRWQGLDTGALVSKESGLVLTKTSVEVNLTMEVNVYAPNQAWVSSNDPNPLVRSIVGLNNLCLTSSVVRSSQFCFRKTATVWVEQCGSNNEARQKWLLYGDGTIRPQQDTTTCLSGDVGVNDDTVRVLWCNPESLGQRWNFKTDGTIWNLHYGQVLDVRRSDPSLKQIILYPNTGNANQKWETRA